jgi:ribosomal protein S10
MSEARTQIYLTEAQRRQIDRVTDEIAMAKVIRRALDEFLGDQPDASAPLSSTLGGAPNASAPSREDWRRG